jgi:hypothetical protein
MLHNMVYGGLGKFGWSWLKERVHLPWFSIPAPTCICGITQYTYCQRSRRGLQDGVSLDRRIPKTCECVCVCCFLYESVVWSVMHVLGVIFLCGRRHLFLAIFFVERTRSIEIKLFASLAESTRADSCRSLLSKANNTICSHCLVYVVQTASLFVCFQSSAFSVLCVVCFVLLVFWSFDVLYILGHLIIANRCILLLTLSTYCNSLWACLVSPLWRRRQRSAQIGGRC